MNQKKRKPKRKLIIGLTVSLAAVGILYGLADRYLIEHVEAVVKPPAAALSAAASASDTATDSASASASASAAATSAASSGADDSADNITSNDWNYTSDHIDISVKKAETGTGADKITYFVADVRHKDSSNLLTAFADNAFGRNIVEDTSEIAGANNAILAINGDYYGFRNDGVVIRNGTLYRNEPARDGLALFYDGTMSSYNEEDVSADELLKQGVTNTFSFGPTLVTARRSRISETSRSIRTSATARSTLPTRERASA